MHRPIREGVSGDVGATLERACAAAIRATIARSANPILRNMAWSEVERGVAMAVQSMIDQRAYLLPDGSVAMPSPIPVWQ